MAIITSGSGEIIIDCVTGGVLNDGGIIYPRFLKHTRNDPPATNAVRYTWGAPSYTLLGIPAFVHGGGYDDSANGIVTADSTLSYTWDTVFDARYTMTMTLSFVGGGPTPTPPAGSYGIITISGKPAFAFTESDFVLTTPTTYQATVETIKFIDVCAGGTVKFEANSIAALKTSGSAGAGDWVNFIASFVVEYGFAGCFQCGCL